MFIKEFRPFIQHQMGLKKEICQKITDLRLKTREMALFDGKETRGYHKNLEVLRSFEEGLLAGPWASKWTSAGL